MIPRCTGFMMTLFFSFLVTPGELLFFMVGIGFLFWIDWLNIFILTWSGWVGLFGFVLFYGLCSTLTMACIGLYIFVKSSKYSTVQHTVTWVSNDIYWTNNTLPLNPTYSAMMIEHFPKKPMVLFMMAVAAKRTMHVVNCCYRVVYMVLRRKRDCVGAWEKQEMLKLEMLKLEMMNNDKTQALDFI